MRLPLQKRMDVLVSRLRDRLDSSATVIRSLSQADSFPCSVASLGRANLFNALDLSTYEEKPMADPKLDTGSR